MRTEQKIFILLSNVDYLTDNYISKIKKKNSHYHFEEIDYKDDENYDRLMDELTIGTFLAEKKFIILKNYIRLPKEIMDVLDSTSNSVCFIFKKNTALVKTLSSKSQAEVFEKKLLFSDDKAGKMELALMLVKDLFVDYEDYALGKVIGFCDDINSIVNELRTISLLTQNLTREVVKDHYNFIEGDKFFHMINSIFLGPPKKLTKEFEKLSDNSNTIMYFYNTLSSLSSNLGRMVAYKKSGNNPKALPIPPYVKNIYKRLENTNYMENSLFKFSKLLDELERYIKFEGNTLEKNYLETKLVSYCIDVRSNEQK